MPNEKHSWIRYFLICHPKIARFSNDKGNTNSDKVKQAIVFSGHPTLNPVFAQLWYDQGAPGTSYSKRILKNFSFHFMTLVSVRGKKQTILVLSKKCENVFSFRTNRDWNVYLGRKL